MPNTMIEAVTSVVSTGRRMQVSETTMDYDPTLGARTATLVPFESKSWPLVTTVSPPSSPLSRTDSLPSTRATFTGRTVATSLLTTNTYVPDWLTWIAVDGTVTASSSRNVNPTVTNVPGHSNSSVFGLVARTGTVPVGASTLFSIMVTWPPARRGSPGMIASIKALSFASAWRRSGRKP